LVADCSRSRRKGSHIRPLAEIAHHLLQEQEEGMNLRKNAHHVLATRVHPLQEAEEEMDLLTTTIAMIGTATMMIGDNATRSEASSLHQEEAEAETEVEAETTEGADQAIRPGIEEPHTVAQPSLNSRHQKGLTA
jgi:hypothetical protein